VRAGRPPGGDPPSASLSPANRGAIEPRVTGTVTGLQLGGGAQSIPDTNATIEFTNHSEQACTVTGYELRWPSVGGEGHARDTALELRVPAHGIVRTVKPINGPAALGMSPSNARVLVTERCD